MPAPQRTRGGRAAQPTRLLLADDIEVELVRKDIRTLRLSVRPPHGRVRLAAPVLLAPAAIQAFLNERLAWIRRHRARLTLAHDVPASDYQTGEHHWFAGRPYRLGVAEANGPERVECDADALVLHMRAGSTRDERRAVLEDWYRGYLKAALPDLIDRHQARLGVQVQAFGVKRMRTRWGSCNPRARRIWLNLELARAAPACLEYVVVHELMHLLERLHNARFHALMDRFLPDWRTRRALLDRLPQRG
ncbi:MAG: SprT family zinc-dependent metalloprotease [Pseudomonadota bacterium]